MDIALHADDIATAGILSGFKWIEPALPFMYFISGYRAGIGYRNGNNLNSTNKYVFLHTFLYKRASAIAEVQFW